MNKRRLLVLPDGKIANTFHDVLTMFANGPVDKILCYALRIVDDEKDILALNQIVRDKSRLQPLNYSLHGFIYSVIDI